MPRLARGIGMRCAHISIELFWRPGSENSRWRTEERRAITTRQTHKIPLHRSMLGCLAPLVSAIGDPPHCSRPQPSLSRARLVCHCVDAQLDTIHGYSYLLLRSLRMLLCSTVFVYHAIMHGHHLDIRDSWPVYFTE